MKNKILYLLFGLLLIFKENQLGDITPWQLFCGIAQNSIMVAGLGAVFLYSYASFDKYLLAQASLENQIEETTKLLTRPAWQSKEDQDKLQRDEKKKREQEKTEQQREEKIMNGSEETTPQSQFPLGKDFKPHEKQESQEGASSHFLAPTVNGIPRGQNQNYSQFYAPIFLKGSSSRLSERLQAMTKLWSEIKGRMGTTHSYNQKEGQYNNRNYDNPFIH